MLALKRLLSQKGIEMTIREVALKALEVYNRQTEASPEFDMDGGHYVTLTPSEIKEIVELAEANGFTAHEVEMEIVRMGNDEMRENGTFVHKGVQYAYESKMVETYFGPENCMTITGSDGTVRKFSECMRDEQIIQMFKDELDGWEE